MRVGIVILPEHPWAQARRLWSMSDEYGFDHGWTYDHLGWRSLLDSPWFGAVSTLAAAATVTTRMGLGFFVTSPAFRHPVPFAREVTSIDHLSSGRLIVGIGSGGGGGYDASVLGGVPIAGSARHRRFEEFVTLLDAVLTNDRTSHAGEFFSAVEARRAPGCVQQPRVPFVVAANGPKAIELAARLGDGWATTGDPKSSSDTWWTDARALCDRFGDALLAAGRQFDDVSRFLHLDSGPVFSLSSVEAFRDALGRAEEAGFTDCITHWPRPEGVYAGSEAVLETVATEVLPTLR